MNTFLKNRQYYKFCSYGFLKNLRFFDAFFILFLMEKGIPFTQIGILYAVREILINVFEVPSGIIADTWGRKISLMGSFIAYILSFVIFYTSGSFWLFMLAFVLYGLGDAFRSGTHKGMIMDYLRINHWEDQKINYYGHTRSWSQRGSALSSLIAGIIVFYTGSYQNIFLYSVIPYLINFFLILSYPAELNHSSKEKVKNRTGFKDIYRAFIDSMKQARVLKLINSSAVHTAYIRAVKDYIQPLMVSLALIIPLMTDIDNDKKSGLFIGMMYFIIYLMTSQASRSAGKIESRRKTIADITLYAGFGLGVICGVFYQNEIWVISIIAFVGIYILENIRKPILTGYVADQVPNEILTSVISAQNLLRTIMTALIALVFGILADFFGIGISLAVTSIFFMFFTFAVNLLRSNQKSQ